MGVVFIGLGAVTGFSRPTEAEANADPATISWGRRPPVRRRFGVLIMAFGILVIVLRVVEVAR
jgi:hypothetical protein